MLFSTILSVENIVLICLITKEMRKLYLSDNQKLCHAIINNYHM